MKRLKFLVLPALYMLRGKIIAETPLHLGSGRGSGMIKHSRGFIPGSFIRGAFGTSLMRLEGEESELFKAVFADELGGTSAMFFRHSYPMHLDGCKDGVFLPSSKTLFVCSNPQCGRRYDTFEPPLRCENDECQRSLESAPRFECSGCGKMKENPINMDVAMHTSVDRETHSYATVGEGKAGTLRAVEAISPGSVFSFQAIIDRSRETDLRKIESVISKSVPEEGIGGSKSRGLGKIRFDDLVMEEVSVDQVRTNATKLNTEKFSAKLVSPMIIEDARRFTASALLEGARRAYSWCFQVGKPALPEIGTETHIQRLEEFSGWSLKAKTRRHIQSSFSAGSAYLFSFKDNSVVLKESLAALEYFAIGGYKPHGYGQITFKARQDTEFPREEMRG